MWRRVAVVSVCFFMAMLEFSNQAVVWATIFAAMGGVSYWKLFLDAETKAKLDGLDQDEKQDTDNDK